MREIKFRAWNSQENEMIENVFPVQAHGDEYIVGQMTMKGFRHYSIPLPIMQYTGLKDKNGLEIYEGDIVKFHDDVVDCFLWDNEWQFHTKENLDNSQSNLNEIECEIIGNIYQNKDLLS